METKTIECPECLGTGKIEKLICTKPVSECCGGCYTYKECYNCGGSGEVEIEIEECDDINPETPIDFIVPILFLTALTLIYKKFKTSHL